MSTPHPRTLVQQATLVLGPVVAVLVAWLLTLPDDGDDAGVTLANVALIIAVIVVSAAVIDWLAGVLTSVMAALALNYFHTEPYRTLRITDRRDVVSVVLLLVLGLAVSAVTAARVRVEVRGLARDRAASEGERLSALLAEDQPVASTWSAAITAAANDLGLLTARLTPKTPAQLPVIGRRMNDGDDPTLTIPATGAALRLLRQHEEGRWLVLTPRAGQGPVSVDRRAVLSFADTIELALGPTSQPVHS
jgi:K+-sensing histidine kinase KdpD